MFKWKIVYQKTKIIDLGNKAGSVSSKIVKKKFISGL